MMNIKKWLLMSIIVLLVLSQSLSAFAHTYLDESNPADGSVVEDELTSIELKFNSNVQQVNIAEITNGEGSETAIENVEHDNELVYLHLTEALETGSYTVLWDIVSNDGHITNGDFMFEVTWERDSNEQSLDEEAYEPQDPAEEAEFTQDLLDAQEEEAEGETGLADSIFYLVTGFVLGLLLLLMIRRKRGNKP